MHVTSVAVNEKEEDKKMKLKRKRKRRKGRKRKSSYYFYTMDTRFTLKNQNKLWNCSFSIFLINPQTDSQGLKLSKENTRKW